MLVEEAVGRREHCAVLPVEASQLGLALVPVQAVALTRHREGAFPHAVEHALALADRAGQQHLVVEIEQLVSAQPFCPSYLLHGDHDNLVLLTNRC